MSAAPKYETRRRYFTAQDAHGAAPPADRLLHLELLEVDMAAGVARFAFELADPAGELWLATERGFASRPEVVERLRDEAPIARPPAGGVLTIPLSADPQVTQIEVRSPALDKVTVYRIHTIGADPREYRYHTESDPGAAVPIEHMRWQEVEGDPGVFAPVADGDADWVVDGGELVLASEPDGTAGTIRRRDDDTIIFREVE